MEIPPLNIRPQLLDLAGETLTRNAAVIREVFGKRELVEAIVRLPPQSQPQRLAGADGRNPNQQAELQRVILQIENRNLEAISPRPLREGQVLSLRLDSAGQVRVAAVDGKPPPPPPALLERAVQQLRPLLARQDSPLPLIRNLFALLSPNLAAATEQATKSAASKTTSANTVISTGTTEPVSSARSASSDRTAPSDRTASSVLSPSAIAATAEPAGPSSQRPVLPPPVAEALLRALASLSSTERLAAELPATIRNNGQFLEARLATILKQSSGTSAAGDRLEKKTVAEAVRAVLSGDVKANLLRLQGALQQALPQQTVATSGSTPPAASAGRESQQFDALLRQLSQAAARGALSGVLASATATAATTATGSTATTTAGLAATATPGQTAVRQPQANPLLQLLSFPSPTPSQGAEAGIRVGESMDLALSTLLRQVAATIARMNVQQLQTVTQQADGPDGARTSSWFSEIPLVHGQQVHLFQLRIDEEDDRPQNADPEESTDKAWCFTLSFDIEPMGPMYAQVRLRREQVSAKFWAEHAQTLAFVREELDHLQSRLSELGLQVTELQAHPGTPEQTRTRIMQQLVDINT